MIDQQLRFKLSLDIEIFSLLTTIRGTKSKFRLQSKRKVVVKSNVQEMMIKNKDLKLWNIYSMFKKLVALKRADWKCDIIKST